VIVKSYKYRLYPSKAQELLLEQTLETCRRWYNTCLAERKEAYETEKRTVEKFTQLRKVKELKQSNPYATNVHSHILQVVALCDYNGETTPANNLECRAEEKIACLRL
jgi:putative transposase